MPPARPSRRRIVSLLWFPFFFAAAFSVLGLLAFHHPVPHGVQIGVAAGPSEAVARAAVSELEHDLGADAFDLVPFPSSEDARQAVAEGRIAAAVDDDVVVVSSASSPTRATYLARIAPVLTASESADTVVLDIAPTVAGDGGGVSLFFYGLPLLLVGLITSIVLLQLGPWPVRNKIVAIVAAGAFTSVFSFLLATALDAIPADPWLLLYGFALTQAIGFLTTAAALSLRQFFMPAAMTFVLILGIPSSGATVNSDMLPAQIGWLNTLLPFAQFINVARASAYFSGTGLGAPLAGLLAWVVAGAGLLAWAARRQPRAVTSVVRG